MRILLINPPIRLGHKPSFFPIGLGYIAQVLLNVGHKVDVLDINAERLSNSKVLERIDLKSKYDVIGTGGLITTYKYLKWLILNLKKFNPDSKIVVGGTVVSERSELLLEKTLADITVIGEGDITIQELCSALEKEKPLNSVRGIVYKDGDQLKKTNPRPLIKDLDTLPYPAYDLFPMEIYLRNISISEMLYPELEINMITSRGCPYNCNFCYDPFGQGIRFNSIDYVIEHLKMVNERYKVEIVIIEDEGFTYNKKRIFEFCRKLRKEKLDIKWSCLARANHVDREMLSVMKAHGCFWISYGIESGSQKILDNMNKRITVAQGKKAIKLTQDVGLTVVPTFMFGYPGETTETITETIQFCKEFLLYPKFFFTTPYPGTKLYEQVKDRILQKYDTEDKFFEVLGDAWDFTINLTDFSDETLLKLKKETERRLRRIPIRKVPQYFLIRYKKYGVLLIRRIIKDFQRFLKFFLKH